MALGQEGVYRSRDCDPRKDRPRFARVDCLCVVEAIQVPGTELVRLDAWSGSSLGPNGGNALSGSTIDADEYRSTSAVVWPV